MTPQPSLRTAAGAFYQWSSRLHIQQPHTFSSTDISLRWTTFHANPGQVLNSAAVASLVTGLAGCPIWIRNILAIHPLPHIYPALAQSDQKACVRGRVNFSQQSVLLGLGVDHGQVSTGTLARNASRFPVLWIRRDGEVKRARVLPFKGAVFWRGEKQTSSAESEWRSTTNKYCESWELAARWLNMRLIAALLQMMDSKLLRNFFPFVRGWLGNYPWLRTGRRWRVIVSKNMTSNATLFWPLNN